MDTSTDNDNVSGQYTEVTDERVESEGHGILMASRIVVKWGMMPVRIVLRKVGNQYITHRETLTTDKPRDNASCRFIHSAFEQGAYFTFSNRKGDGERECASRAYNEFKARVKEL